MRMISRRRALATTVAICIMPQAALAAPVCEGEYSIVIGGATPAIQGKVPGVANPVNTEQGTIKVEDCGRKMVIDGDGGAIVLARDPLDPAHYFGTHQGAPAYFDVLSPHRITGQIPVPSTTSSVIFDMRMIEGRMPDFDGCDSEKSKPADALPGEDRLTVDPALRREVIGIVAARLGVPQDRAQRYISAAKTVAKTRSSDKSPTVIAPGEEGCPEEFAGVRECLRYPPETTTIVETNVLLDKEGRLLPITTKGSGTGRVRVDDPGAADFCAPKEAGPEAETRLRFKFFAIEADGINDVQAVLADAKTDRAKKAHYAEGKSNGRQGRSDAAAAAYEAIGAPAQGLYEPAEP